MKNIISNTIRLQKFKKIIDKTVRFCKKSNPDINFIYKNTEFIIKKIVQFNVIPDVYIYLEKSTKNNKCGLVVGKELRYWLYAITVDALISAAQGEGEPGVNGVFEDIKDEYKVRVNKSYEIAQILKSGDCYDTPYFNKVVEVVDENGKVLGHTYIELTNDGKNVLLEKMPYKLLAITTL